MRRYREDGLVLAKREGDRRKVAFEWFSEDKPTLSQKRMKKVEEL